MIGHKYLRVKCFKCFGQLTFFGETSSSFDVMKVNEPAVEKIQYIARTKWYSVRGSFLPLRKQQIGSENVVTFEAKWHLKMSRKNLKTENQV